GDAVEDRAHRVLADAEVDHGPVRAAGPLVPGVVAWGEAAGTADGDVVGLGEVGRAAPQPRHMWADRVEHGTAGDARGGLPRGVTQRGERLAGRPRHVAGAQGVVQSGPLGLGLAPRGVAGLPLLAQPCPALADA